ncbi:MAG: DNA polymerase III subunit delta [Tepidanaerobacteraceae bacterium]|jgi:DNA polymerase-3 subunit delta|nr:DNA polymerase III subunit delta [Tepidanaerobacteraceae bacterium]
MMNNNILLFFGEEKFLIKEEIRKIKESMIPPHMEAVNFMALDGRTASEDEIITNAMTIPMLDDKKMMVVDNARFFETATKGKEGSDSSKDDEFIQNLNKIPSYTLLIFTCEKADKRKKIFKWLQKEGAVREFQALSLKDKAVWVQKRVAFYGKRIDLSLAYFIAQNTGDLYQTEMELRKITDFIGGEEIRKNDIMAVFSGSLEKNIFDLTDYIGMKKTDMAVYVLHDLLLKGEKGIVILYMISKHIMDLISVKLLKNAGFQELKQRLGMHPFVLKKAVEQAENFTLGELERNLKLCQQLDLDIKKGKIDDKKGIELLVAKMTE